MKQYYLVKTFFLFLLSGIALSSCDDLKEDVIPTKLVVADDAYGVIKNQGLTFNVLENDQINAAATLTFSKPKNGTLLPGTSGLAFYQPNPDFTGKDSLTYTACIGNECALATIRITVTDTTTCEVKAANDQYDLKQNRSLVFQPLQNDVLCGAQLFMTQPLNGVISPNGNSWEYTPATNFYGLDEATYTLTLGNMSVSATITFNVLPNTSVTCNSFARNDSLNILQGNQSVVINILGNDDVCGARLNIIQHPLPGQGMAGLTANKELAFQPNPNYTGQVVIRYALTGPNGYTEASVFINVDPNLPNPCNVDAVDDQISKHRNANLAMDSVVIYVLNNDFICPNKPAPVISLVTQSNYGQVIYRNNPNNPYIVYYVPNGITYYTDSCQYRVCQGNDCDDATVSVWVY